MKTGAIGFALLQAQAMRPAFAAQDAPGKTGRIEIDVTNREGDNYQVFDVRAGALVGASVQRAWQVLTDYDRLAEFVPHMVFSRLISRDDHECIVEQEGYGQFLFIKRTVSLLMHVLESPYSNIALTLLKGNMHEYQAEWQLTAVETDLTQIVYTGTVAPAFYVPSLFGSALMKSDLRTMLAAVVREIEKPDPPQ